MQQQVLEKPPVTSISRDELIEKMRVMWDFRKDEDQEELGLLGAEGLMRSFYPNPKALWHRTDAA